ncbi:HPr kinase/phosphorylase [Xanthobacter pseudotagetidis]|uniref:HPr kinase/phosphorylase n=1 Tax=Xanthobacter pseudotagetidis TaxID=3119911 RepID=UPI003728D2B9
MAAPGEPAAAPAPQAPLTMHGTCVAVDGKGVLILGPSGAGKSTLALKLILDAPRSLPLAELVADDRVVLELEDGVLTARPPPLLAGLIEVRGLGIRRLPHRPSVALACQVDLQPDAQTMRMPEKEALIGSIRGCVLQRISAGTAEEASLLLAALLSSADYQN